MEVYYQKYFRARLYSASILFILRKCLLPALFNFRAGSNSNFKDDSHFRNIEPSKSNRIELARLIKDFTYECYISTKQQLSIYRFV